LATLIARNANEAMVANMVGSGGVCVWQESGFSRCEDVFAFNFIKNVYKFCTFNAISKDNAAINFITAQHKEVHSRQL
jgi:hypothetical protein